MVLWHSQRPGWCQRLSLTNILNVSPSTAHVLSLICSVMVLTQVGWGPSGQL